ncbi:MAG: DUF374 domain-containing protein [Pseudomonadota bacterium]
MAAGMLKRVRRRAEAVLATPAAQAPLASGLAWHLRRAFEATEWQVEGRDGLARDAAQGPVILALWHGRLMCAARFWDTSWGPLTTLTSQQYPGRLAGQAFRRFGLPTVAMHDRRTNRSESLALARAMRSGMSIGVAVDGPLGPARVAKTVPLDWSRLTGAPIWCVGFSMTRFRQLSSWDNLLVPKAGGSGLLLYRRWGVAQKGQPSDDMRADLEAALNEVTDAADLRLGHLAPLP